MNPPDVTGPAAARSESVTDLLKELRDEATALVRQEVALLKTETSEKVSKILRNLAYVGVGALVALIGAFLIFEALASLVTLGLLAAGLKASAYWLGPLLVGLVVAAVGAGLALKGVNAVKNESLKPEKTLDSLKKDKEWLQHKHA